MDNDRFEALLTQARGRLLAQIRAHSMLSHEDAEDLLHNCLLELNIAQIDETQGPAMQYVAKLIRWRLPRHAPRQELLSGGEPPDVVADQDSQDQWQRLEEAVLALPTPIQRALMDLCLDGLRPAEAAKKLGISRQRASFVWHEAVRWLRKRLRP